MKPMLTPKLVLRQALTRKLDTALGKPRPAIPAAALISRPAIADVIAVAAETMDILPIEILRKSQVETVVLARHLAMYVAVRAFGFGFSEVGLAMKRDHTTVMHGVGRIAGMIEAGIDPILMVTKVIGIRAEHRRRAQRTIADRRDLPPQKPWFDQAERDPA